MEIEIRRAIASDMLAVKSIYDCENAYRNTLHLPDALLQNWASYVASSPDSFYSYIASIDCEVVGNLGFELCTTPRRRHVASIGMGVKDNYQGLGVGSALLATAINLADKWLNLTRLELSVYTDNERAITLYKKFGFEIEGESKNYAFRDGQYVSVYHMARIVRL